MNKKNIAERLKSLRIAAGLTKHEVAVACNVSDSTVRMWELGERIPRDKEKVKLADMFNQTVQTIFFAQ